MNPRGLLLPLVCAGQFMVVLDTSIVNVALPTIGADLGFTSSGIAWVVTGYLLTFAGFLLLGGRAADLAGHRRTLVAGLTLFTASSLVAGLAGAPATLVAARVAQGTGAALLAPATLAAINTHFAGTARARALGAWSAAGGLGGTAGALAGGALTTGLSWRWIFLINVPIGALLIGLALLAPAAGGRRGSLDLPGALTGTAGLATLVYGVLQHVTYAWAAGLLLLAVFVLVERAAGDRAMMPLRLFAVPGVAAGTTMLLLFGGVTIAMWYFTSLHLQRSLGFSALQAGLGQTPAAVAFVLVARVAAGPRRLVLVGGGACLVAGFGWLGTGGGYATGFLVPSLLVAAGIGLAFPTMTAVATGDAAGPDAGIAGGLAATAGQVGAALGLAALTAAAGEPPDFRLVFLCGAGLGAAVALIGSSVDRREQAVRH